MDKDINAVQYDDLRKKGYNLQATQKLKAPSMTLNARSIDATRKAIIHSIEEIRKETIRADTKKHSDLIINK